LKGKAVSILIIFSVVLTLSFGKTAPDFSVKDENGKIVNRDDLKGKPTLLIFWGVLCTAAEKRCLFWIDFIKSMEEI